ncbi:MAG: YhfC family intramembrane metalloprotease [Chloroflexi bacterium]|nr:YhfC family intramembrane metalloprotease [Chloroflexota bacterium]
MTEQKEIRFLNKPLASSPFILVLMLLMGMLAGCTASAPDWQTMSPQPPWQDGEVATYNINAPDGSLMGVASWRISAQDDGWLLSHELVMAGSSETSTVTMDSQLRPQNSQRITSQEQVEVVYHPGEALLTVTRDGVPSTRQVSILAGILDNDQLLLTLRALPWSADLAASADVLVTASGAHIANRMLVTGQPVTLTLPAGQFNAWHVNIRTGAETHEAWYSQDAPHLLLQYRNPNSGLVFVLRSWQPAAGAPLEGDATPPPTAEELAQMPVTFKMNWPYILLGLLVQAPAMIGIAFVAGWWIRKRYGAGWNVFLYGAIVFGVSRIVHIAISQLLTSVLGANLAAWPLLATALVVGLMAGLSEQGTNWIGLRFFWKHLRGFGEGLQYGAGHGGAEAVGLGVLALATLLNVVFLNTWGPEGLGLSGASAHQANLAFSQLLSAPLYMPIVAALERVMAMILQITMAVLVMRSLTRRQPLWWLAALAIHTLIDAWAVLGMNTVGVLGTEAVLAVITAGAIGLLWLLREPPPNALEG